MNYGNGNIISAIELDIFANYILHLFFFNPFCLLKLIEIIYTVKLV